MLAFDNSFARLHTSFYSRVQATALQHPAWVTRNRALAAELGIELFGAEQTTLLHAFSGAAALAFSDALAMVYAGHQFGHYVPQLGDGRGLLLGQMQTPDGLRDLHLKGAGRTPYSRGGDGRAVLRSCIREYIGSEALHALGIPTTRALCITTGSDTVWRETREPAAMLVRVAASHIRFGSFEFFHYTGQQQRVRELADYCIEHYYPSCDESRGDQRYTLFLQAVVDRTARLIALWQCTGFAHGVLNTDNMSIIGDTFDFGPYGFLDRYDAAFICNHSDHQGRYAFNAQPGIGLWNLTALAQALSSLLNEEQRQQALANYEPALIRYYSATMLRKLGLQQAQNTDQALVQDLLELMQANAADFTLVFRELSEVEMHNNVACRVASRFTRAQGFTQWLERYRKRLRNNPLHDDERRQLMQQCNPLYVPRNHLAQIAIERAENGDYSELEQLVAVLSEPFTEQCGRQKYAAEAPAWSESLQISCSS